MFNHGIRFEVAQDALGALIAHWSEAEAQVQDAVNPDLARLAEIDAGQRKLRFSFTGRMAICRVHVFLI